MADHNTPKVGIAKSKRAQLDANPAINHPDSALAEAPSSADLPEMAYESPASAPKPCDSRCERFAACRPDSPGWVLKKEVAAHLKTTMSALKMRALRLGYVSPAHRAIPRGDQPKLCFDAAYFVLLQQVRRKKQHSRTGGNCAQGTNGK